jgi:hypothetical protein
LRRQTINAAAEADNLRRQHAEALESLVIAHADELKGLKQQHEMALSDLQRSSMEATTARLDAVAQQHMAELAALHDQHHKDLDTQQRKHALVVEAYESVKKIDSQSLNEQQVYKLEEMRMLNQRELATIAMKHRDAIADALAKQQQDFHGKMQKQDRKHMEELQKQETDLKANYLARVDKLLQDHRAEVMQAQDDAKQQQETWQARLAAEVTRCDGLMTEQKKLADALRTDALKSSEAHAAKLVELEAENRRVIENLWQVHAQEIDHLKSQVRIFFFVAINFVIADE